MGGRFGAGVLGSMQGRWGGELSKQDALKLLAEGCAELGICQKFNFLLSMNTTDTTTSAIRLPSAVLLNTLGDDRNVAILDLFREY